MTGTILPACRRLFKKTKSLLLIFSFSYVVDRRVLEGSYRATFSAGVRTQLRDPLRPGKAKQEYRVGHVGQSMGSVGSRNYRNWVDDVAFALSVRARPLEFSGFEATYAFTFKYGQACTNHHTHRANWQYPKAR